MLPGVALLLLTAWTARALEVGAAPRKWGRRPGGEPIALGLHRGDAGAVEGTPRPSAPARGRPAHPLGTRLGPRRGGGCGAGRPRPQHPGQGGHGAPARRPRLGPCPESGARAARRPEGEGAERVWKTESAASWVRSRASAAALPARASGDGRGSRGPLAAPRALHAVSPPLRLPLRGAGGGSPRATLTGAGAGVARRLQQANFVRFRACLLCKLRRTGGVGDSAPSRLPRAPARPAGRSGRGGRPGNKAAAPALAVRARWPGACLCAPPRLRVGPRVCPEGPGGCGGAAEPRGRERPALRPPPEPADSVRLQSPWGGVRGAGCASGKGSGGWWGGAAAPPCIKGAGGLMKARPPPWCSGDSVWCPWGRRVLGRVRGVFFF